MRRNASVRLTTSIEKPEPPKTSGSTSCTRGCGHLIRFTRISRTACGTVSSSSPSNPGWSIAWRSRQHAAFPKVVLAPVPIQPFSRCARCDRRDQMYHLNCVWPRVACEVVVAPCKRQTVEKVRFFQKKWNVEVRVSVLSYWFLERWPFVTS